MKNGRPRSCVAPVQREKQVAGGTKRSIPCSMWWWWWRWWWSCNLANCVACPRTPFPFFLGTFLGYFAGRNRAEMSTESGSPLASEARETLWRTLPLFVPLFPDDPLKGLKKVRQTLGKGISITVWRQGGVSPCGYSYPDSIAGKLMVL